MREAKDIRLLLVDDEVALRKAIAFDFKRKGFQVSEASSGHEALQLIKQQKFDVVLSDVRMPNGDGIDLVKGVRELEQTVPVVMLITGFADISVSEAYDLGVHAIFSKPFDRKALLNAVLRVAGSKDEMWMPRGQARENSSLHLKLNFASSKEAIAAHTLNIGQGGMFVRLDNRYPTVNEEVSFEIYFQEGLPRAIQGLGAVRWVRGEKSAEGDAGCGVEFLELSDDSRAALIQFINGLRVKAFIPKG